MDLGSLSDLRRSAPEQRVARRRGCTRRVAVNDAVVAVALAVLTALPLARSGESFLLVWLLDLALVLPLALRRRHPGGVFALVALLAGLRAVCRRAEAASRRRADPGALGDF